MRWGAQEKPQLAAAIDQPSILYWAGKGSTNEPLSSSNASSSFTRANTSSRALAAAAALPIAIAAAGIGPGDEVITTPNTDLGSSTGVLFQPGRPASPISAPPLSIST